MYLCCGPWKSSSSAPSTSTLFTPHLPALQTCARDLGQRSRVGFCPRCRRSLAVDSGKDDSKRYSALRQETPEWEMWVANRLPR